MPRAQIIPRVLVVEDDNQLAEILGEVLTYENCTADLSGNGIEALDKLRSADYDAVICDLMMPRLDGKALYREVIKEFPHLAEKFLFITGQASHHAGFSDFVLHTGNTLLEKPFDIELFRTALREMLAR